MTSNRVKPTTDIDNQSVILPGTENGERIRINSRIIAPEEGKDDVMNWLVSEFYEGVNTVYDCFKRGSSKFPDNQFLGDRRHGGADFQYKTYKQVGEMADKFGSQLISALGQAASNETRVGIYSGNCWEWTTAGIACCNYNMIMVPLYDTLGGQAMRFIVKQCAFDVVVIDNEKRFQVFLDDVQTHAEGCKIPKVVMFDKLSDEVAAKAEAAGVSVSNFQELIDSCGDVQPHNPPKPEDIFVINYTSGTTGDPKGVMLTHKNWVANMGSACYLLPREINEKDSWLSYLPCAHVFERMLQTILMNCGSSIGFFGGDPRQLVADAGSLRPTIFGGVPRVWNRIYGRLQAAQSESFIKKHLIGWAMKNKVALLKKGIITKTSIYDKLVFGKIQALLGGRVELAITGAAPLRNEVLNNIRAALGCHLIEAYGQTEVAAAATATGVRDWRPSVGAPVMACALRLDSVPEMNYLCENDEGEICIKGHCTMQGYLNNPEKTADTIDKDGWVHTGDIGRWTEHGTLQIFDRKKHIFKLAQGEYIAPEKIENIYINHPAVAQCFVHGDSLKTKLVGIMIPDPDVFPNWSKGSGDLEALCKDKAITERLLSELKKLGLECGLKSFENVAAIYLEPAMLTVESGLLTPTMKSKRPQLKKHFESQIGDLYNSLPNQGD